MERAIDLPVGQYRKMPQGDDDALKCQKCNQPSDLLYSVHAPTPVEPTRILKVCMPCLNKHRQEGGGLPASKDSEQPAEEGQ